MKRHLLAGIAALGLVGPASAASLECTGSHMLVGNPGNNSVTSSFIYRDDAGRWTVHHILADSKDIDRSSQYSMTDVVGGPPYKWQGASYRNANLSMVGQVGYDNNRQLAYDEWLYDRGQLIMHSSSACHFDGSNNHPVVASAPPATPAPTSVAATPGEDSVGIISSGARAGIQVRLGSRTELMLIDTGADGMSVTQETANALVANNEAHFQGTQTVKIADGSDVRESVVIISTMRVGSHVLHNVPATVTENPNAEELLPFPVLNQMGRFTIDTNNNKLIFG